MIKRHEVKILNGEEVLYIYVDFSYEFAKELGNSEKQLSLIEHVKKYISDLKIKWNGTKVILAVGGIAIGTLLIPTGYYHFNNRNTIEKPVINEIIKDKTEIIEIEDKEEISNPPEKEIVNNPEKPNSPSNQPIITEKPKAPAVEVTKKPVVETKPPVEKPIINEPIKPEKPSQGITQNEKTVTVYRSNGIVETIKLEEYIIGVVAAEMPASFNEEALKAGAIVARTYALKRVSENKVLTDTVSTQSYIDYSQMQNKWGKNFDYYYNRIKNAVTATKGIVIKYNNKYIDAVYHSTSNGYTADAKSVWGNDIPYLKSVESKWDLNVSSYQKEISISFAKLNQILGLNLNSESAIEILSKDNTFRVSQVMVGDNTYTGIELRTKLGLRSNAYDISNYGDKIVITTYGYGHGVGMSQYGANEMAKLGYTYNQILNHYYTNVNIVKE